MTLEQTIESIVRAVVREELKAVASGSSNTWPGCLKLSDAAKLVSVSVSTLEKWGRAGLRIMQRGAVRRVDVAELRAFMQQRETTGPVEPEQRAREILANVSPLRRLR